MMAGFALYVNETLVVRFCACAMSLDSAWVRETGKSPESPIPLPQTPSASHPRAQRNASRRRRCASEIQIVRPLESIAETQHQLQSALGIVGAQSWALIGPSIISGF